MSSAEKTNSDWHQRYREYPGPQNVETFAWTEQTDKQNEQLICDNCDVITPLDDRRLFKSGRITEKHRALPMQSSSCHLTVDAPSAPCHRARDP